MLCLTSYEDEQNFYIGKFVQELRVGEVDAFLKGI